MSPSTPSRTNRPADTPAASRRRKANNEELRILTARNEAQKRVRAATTEWHKIKSKKENENENNFYVNIYSQMMRQLQKNIEKAQEHARVPTARELKNAKLLMTFRNKALR
jgi:hypothetical protein